MGENHYGRPCQDCYECQEFYDADKYKKAMKKECEEDEFDSGSHVVKECPKGYVKKCEWNDDGPDGKASYYTKVFYYGEGNRDVTCRDREDD
jgi:hypothetical protein